MAAQKSGSNYSEPAYADSSKPKTAYPWYTENIDKYITPKTQTFLSEYCKIPPAQHSTHVHHIRDRAWAVRSYPCVGLGVWLVPSLTHSPAYPAILQRLKEGETLLDVGCLFGGDMRALAYDGAPSDRMVGVDIVSHWDIGYEMYCDRGSFRARFVNADIMKPEESGELRELEGRVGLVSVSAVLHQWLWEPQVACAKKLVPFSKVGTLVFGYQIGSREGKVVELKGGVPQFRQSPESFKKMWDLVGEATGTGWETEARLVTFEDIGWDPKDTSWMEEGTCILEFVVTRKK